MAPPPQASQNLETAAVLDPGGFLMVERLAQVLPSWEIVLEDEVKRYQRATHHPREHLPQVNLEQEVVRRQDVLNSFQTKIQSDIDVLRNLTYRALQQSQSMLS